MEKTIRASAISPLVHKGVGNSIDTRAAGSVEECRTVVTPR